MLIRLRLRFSRPLDFFVVNGMRVVMAMAFAMMLMGVGMGVTNVRRLPVLATAAADRARKQHMRTTTAKRWPKSHRHGEVSKNGKTKHSN
jgi:hypothetical protein